MSDREDSPPKRRRPRKKPMRRKRYLLTAVALSTGALMSGCGSQQDVDDNEQVNAEEGDYVPLPANPKGSNYDDGAYDEVTEDEVTEDEDDGAGEDGTGDGTDTTDSTGNETEDGAGDEGADEPPRPLPLPANPKGALYDQGAYPGDPTETA